MATIRTEDEERLCKCGHPGLDHGLWMGMERLEVVEKTRRVGCRVVGCECEGWTSIVGDFYRWVE